jgi:DNA-3-methyladenine glycosylase
VSPGGIRPVPRRFYEQDVLAGAPQLLNKRLVRLGRDGAVTRAARIVEVEAYRGDEDPASHAYRGPTRRNATMFGPPGHLYVYFTYGMHWCANAVFGPEGTGHAVLLRALAPEAGLSSMRAARRRAQRSSARDGDMPDRMLTNGPARLCAAFGITGRLDGADLVAADHDIVVVDDGIAPPTQPGVSARIGIRVATDRPWRYFVEGDPHLSRRRSQKGDPPATERPET